MQKKVKAIFFEIKAEAPFISDIDALSTAKRIVTAYDKDQFGYIDSYKGTNKLGLDFIDSALENPFKIWCEEKINTSDGFDNEYFNFHDNEKRAIELMEAW